MSNFADESLEQIKYFLKWVASKSITSKMSHFDKGSFGRISHSEWIILKVNHSENWSLGKLGHFEIDYFENGSPRKLANY